MLNKVLTISFQRPKLFRYSQALISYRSSRNNGSNNGLSTNGSPVAGGLSVASLFCRNNNNCRSLSTVGRSVSWQIQVQQQIKSRRNPNEVNDTMPINRDHFTIPNDQPVVVLDCKQAFDSLNPKEKLYAHYLSRASWYGGLIVLVQTSPESPLIFLLLHKLYRDQGLVKNLKNLAMQECNFTNEDFLGLLVYTSGIYTNMGNYKGFGDSKFVPNLEQAKLEMLVKASKAYKKNPKMMQFLWDNSADAIFSLNDVNKQLGLKGKGVTTYFSGNCTSEDAEFINRFLNSKSIEAYNNRLFKVSNGDVRKYEVRLASVLPSDSTEDKSLIGTHTFEGATIDITRGDYSPLLNIVIDYLAEAKENAADETQTKMLQEYIHSFRTGSIDAHKNGSRFWIKDKGPVIETYIGFIETYRDPAGQRGEFEGFVAMVNKEMSAKFSVLVENAESFLKLLPWPAAFEKDRFLRPDFTSLDVLSFAGSGVPAGINIPNYDEIRQQEGFKNVSLGNVLPASLKDSKPLFVSPKDQELLDKYRVGSFEVQVGLHELLGHGSGKLFIRQTNGSFNFDQSTVKNPLTGEKINKWYEEGESYDSKFSSMGSTYEECRAESVGLVLCLYDHVLKIFSYEGQAAEDAIYINWLSLFLSALKGLEMYQPDAGVWGQAHSQARYVILRVCLEAGEGLVTVSQTTGADGNPDLLLTLDRSKIKTIGKIAMETFLKKLQIYKSMGDVNTARQMYMKYSEVTNEGNIPFLQYRDIVVARRQPRKMLVQSNTTDEGGNVFLSNYEASHESLIESWIDRFPNDDIDTILVDMWKKDEAYFQSKIVA